MASEQRFLIVKSKDSREIKYFEYDKIQGYNLTPKANARFEDAIDVSRMIIINPSLIEKLVDKKLKKKFDKLISLITVVCEDNDQSGSGYMLALNETEKFRLELISKYKQHLEIEKYELLLKKTAILEDELKLRLQVIVNTVEREEELNKEGKAR